MRHSPQLPDLAEGSPDSLFSVPYNLVSSEMASEYADDERLDSIPVTDAEGLTVATAELKDDTYYFHLPPELAKEANLGNVYFEFRLRADFHDSWSSRKGREEDTQAILMLPV